MQTHSTATANDELGQRNGSVSHIVRLPLSTARPKHSEIAKIKRCGVTTSAFSVSFEVWIFWNGNVMLRNGTVPDKAEITIHWSYEGTVCARTHWGIQGAFWAPLLTRDAMKKPGDRDRRPYSNSLYCGVSSTRCRHTKDMQSSISFRYSFVTKSSHNHTAQI